ncbi:hypothetical protein K7432_015100 [Basidiobolus ranarum]|uniref:Thionin-like protein n=1 Tax=Basidiobolus ranarum TaxID=34480 RepID=A0ABR2VP52_9FUNG
MLQKPISVLLLALCLMGSSTNASNCGSQCISEYSRSSNIALDTYNSCFRYCGDVGCRASCTQDLERAMKSNEKSQNDCLSMCK